MFRHVGDTFGYVMTHFERNLANFWYKYIFYTKIYTFCTKIVLFCTKNGRKHVYLKLYQKMTGFVSKCVITYPKSVEDMCRHVGDVFEDVRDVSE